MKIQSEYSHTIAGGIYFDLPLGILLCFLFHEVVKNALIKNLPRFIQSKFQPILEISWMSYFKSNWLITIVSILIGVYSHIFWDAFTHENAFFVDWLRLDQALFNSNYPIYKVLQHAGTFLGGLYIIYYILKLRNCEIQGFKPSVRFWIVFWIILVGIMIAKIFTGLNLYQFGNVIVSGISASMISLVAVSLVYKVIDEKRIN